METEHIKELIIMQGWSGGGKSFIVDALIEKYKQMDVSISICSTDNFWYTKVGDDPTKYNFDRNRLNEAHQWNRGCAENGMKLNIQVIIIDNTNIQQKEAQPYIDMGKKYGYNIRIISVSGDVKVAKKANSERPNDRQVPEFVIENQIKHFKRLYV